MNTIALCLNAGTTTAISLTPIAMALIVLAIAILETQYKDYLFGCKKLRLDPTKVYEQSVIDERIAALTDVPAKEQKKLTWFKKNYQKMEGGIFGNKIVTRARKATEKGKLKIDYEVEE